MTLPKLLTPDLDTARAYVTERAAQHPAWRTALEAVRDGLTLSLAVSRVVLGVDTITVGDAVAMAEYISVTHYTLLEMGPTVETPQYTGPHTSDADAQPRLVEAVAREDVPDLGPNDAFFHWQATCGHEACEHSPLPPDLSSEELRSAVRNLLDRAPPGSTNSPKLRELVRDLSPVFTQSPAGILVRSKRKRAYSGLH